jgi:hypothetical protein
MGTIITFLDMLKKLAEKAASSSFLLAEYKELLKMQRYVPILAAR